MRIPCQSCSRPFETEEVSVYRFRFPADRYCAFCREAEHVRDEQRRADILWTQTRVPKDFAEAGFSNFQIRDGVQDGFTLARKFAEEIRQGRRPRRGLLLHGRPGSGKTHLAVAILRETIYSTNPRRSIFINVPDWLNGLRAAWNNDDAAEPTNPTGYQLAVIDDLGAEQATPWSRERIYSLLNEREQNNLLTIVTSNLSPDDLAGMLGKAAASRLTRLCASVAIDSRHDYRELLAEKEDVA